ncbi:hypothetical protein WG66_010116 [Moniliophthora roreri]|nr:hypothetical protein WG66_010116 [Moniliophthora roreri]
MGNMNILSYLSPSWKMSFKFAFSFNVSGRSATMIYTMTQGRQVSLEVCVFPLIVHMTVINRLKRPRRIYRVTQPPALFYRFTYCGRSTQTPALSAFQHMQTLPRGASPHGTGLLMVARHKQGTSIRLS